MKLPLALLTAPVSVWHLLVVYFLHTGGIMPKPNYVLALDSGTTSVRTLLFRQDGTIADTAQSEFPQHYPQPGWVEHDPMDIWSSQIGTASRLLEKRGIDATEVAAIGITNQRETVIAWNRSTGKPVCNGIVWQDRRTAGMCEEIKQRGAETTVREKAGLTVNSYFSATKMAWILQNVPEARRLADSGELALGTVDCWLLWNLTQGAVYATDATNASRTMLYNIRTAAWDEELCRIFDIPIKILPDVKPSSARFGVTGNRFFGGRRVPITGIAGDQQAALFGHGCFSEGSAKTTFGTGSFVLMNTGGRMIESGGKLLSTVAWKLGGTVTYALEGSIFITGAAIQWLRDELRVIHDAADTEYFASKVPDTGGVYMVPAFAGLGAPYWDMYARGIIVGITRGTNMNHIIRAALESLAYQTRAVFLEMEKESGISGEELRVDGGASVNNFLMQFQADILDVPVVRPKTTELTARGAAFFAGIEAGFWEGIDDLPLRQESEHRFFPGMDEIRRDELYKGWEKAVERSMNWEKED